MSREPAPQHAETTLSEDAAHRLLARAVELDARHGSQLSIAQLREIAREAGIAPEAFDEALTEIRASTEDTVGAKKPGFVRWKALATNAIAVAAFWLVLSALSRITGSLDWPTHHAALILANLLGVGISLRLRARPTAVVLGVTAAAQLAEYVMHLLFGIQTVQGGPTKWALMLAGLLGITLGTVMARSRKPPAHTISEAADERAGETNPGVAEPDQPPTASLRLRPV